MQVQAGSIVENRYLLERELGSGAWGTVYLAQDQDLGRQVAIKFLSFACPGGSEVSQRFEREAKILSQLLHANIVRVFRYGMLNGQNPYIVMEYLPGESLRAILDRKKQFNCKEAVQIALQIARALAYAHKSKVVHRDLKPENLILLEDGGNYQVKLLDFGLCKQDDPEANQNNTITRTGTLIGTAFYMSPEQCKGMVTDWRTDIYSFACLLFEMITGAAPFVSEAIAEVMLKHLSDPMPSLLELAPDSGLPQDLDDLILKCAAKNKEDRVQSFEEIGETLAEIQKLNCTKTFKRQRSKKGSPFAWYTKLPRACKIGVPVVLVLSLSAAGFFLFATESGKLLLSMEVQRRMTPADAIANLTELARRQVEEKNTSSATKIMEESIKSRQFNTWSIVDRTQLLNNYISLCKEPEFAKESFQLKLHLLSELLVYVQNQFEKARQARVPADSEQLKTLLDLSQELLNSHLSKSEWTKISNTLESQWSINVYDRRGNSLLWLYVLRCRAMMVAGVSDDDVRDRVGQILIAAEMAEAANRIPLMHRLLKDGIKLSNQVGEYTRLTDIHTHLGMHYLRQNKLAEAKNELALAKKFAEGRALKSPAIRDLNSLELSCKNGRIMEAPPVKEPERIKGFAYRAVLKDDYPEP